MKQMSEPDYRNLYKNLHTRITLSIEKWKQTEQERESSIDKSFCAAMAEQLEKVIEGFEK